MLLLTHICTISPKFASYTPTDITTTPQPQAQEKRDRKVSSIILREKSKFTILSKHQTERKIKYGNARALEEGVQLKSPTKGDYRAIVSHLNTNKIEYHTFQTEEGKTLRVEIEGVIELR